MPRVPKPVLWWSSREDGSDVLSAVLSDKKVWLHGSGVRQHTPFQIRRRNLLTRIPHLGRRLFGSYVSDIPTVYLGNGAMRSKTYWQATNVLLPPNLADYYFTDGNGGTSGSLAVTNTPILHWKSLRHGRATLRPKVDIDLTSNGYAKAELGDLQRDYELTFEGEVHAPQDPDVRIEVLDPGTSEDLLMETAHDVLQYELESLAINQDRFLRKDVPSAYQLDQYLTPALRHVRSFLGRRYIHFAVEGETRFIATTKEPRTVSLTLKGDGPVRLLFAIQTRNLETGTRSVSEFMPVIVRAPQLG